MPRPFHHTAANVRVRIYQCPNWDGTVKDLRGMSVLTKGEEVRSTAMRALFSIVATALVVSGTI